MLILYFSKLSACYLSVSSCCKTCIATVHTVMDSICGWLSLVTNLPSNSNFGNIIPTFLLLTVTCYKWQKSRLGDAKDGLLSHYRV